MKDIDAVLENEDPFHCMKGILALLGTFLSGLLVIVLVRLV